MSNGKIVPMDKAQGSGMIPLGKSFFFDAQRFEHAQRVGKMLCHSTMVPEHFRGEKNLGNVLIALNFSERHSADPFMIMQNIYIVHGKPGIEGKLVIALVNKSGRFEPLKFRFDDEENPKSCTCYTKEIKTGQELTQTVTWDTVEKEGWAAKNGSKWLTMPYLMFQYRAATFFARVYCPEVLMGMMTTEELNDIVDMEATHNGSYAIKERTEGKLEALKKRLEADTTQTPEETASVETSPNDNATGPKDNDNADPTEGGKYKVWPLFKNLRTNYASEVWKVVRSGAIHEATEDDLKQMKRKWARQVPDDDWPLDVKEGDSEPEVAPPVDIEAWLANDSNIMGLIPECPRMDNNSVPRAECRSCEDATHCENLLEVAVKQTYWL